MFRAASLSLLFVSACTCDTPVSGQTFACASQDDCASGWSCIARVCVQDGAGGGSGGGGGGSTGGGSGGGAQPCFVDAQCTDGRCVNDVCVPLLSNGEACAIGSECRSTFCAGTVCCDTACTGACSDCNLPASPGTCSPVAAGQPGTPACAPLLCDGARLSCPGQCTPAAGCVAPAFCDVDRMCVTSDAPRAVEAPAILSDGGFHPGVPLAADDGVWGSSASGAITTTHVWLRCDADGGNCTPLVSTGTLTGSGLQTDATRTAAAQGDGLSPESSVGTWAPATNLITNGGAETNLTGWSSWAGSGNSANFPSVVRDTTDRKFGVASALVTTNGAEVDQDFLVYATGLTPSTAYVASGWVRAPAGAQLCISWDEFDAADVYLTSSNAVPFTGTGAWQRAAIAATTGPSTMLLHILISTCASTGQALTFHVDGLQLERGTAPTPYIETDGATATRGASVLTAPASLLPLDLGWAAFRARPRWTAASSNLPYPTLLHLTTSVTDKLDLYYNVAAGWWALERNNGTQNGVTSTRAAAPGTPVTVVAAWTPTQTKISTDGAPFATLASSQIPSAGAVIDLTALDGEVLWMVLGSGALSDAQAAALHAFGDTDPTFTALPAGASMLWTADTLAYTTAGGGSAATYTPTAADLGYTFRLVVTATSANGTTTVTSAPFGPVVTTPPVSLGAPALSVPTGGWYRGGVAASSQGSWSGAISFAYQWERCDAMGQSCAPATGSGSTTSSYTIAAADVGGRLRATVTATNTGGSTSRTSATSPVIVNAPPVFQALANAATFTAATTVSLARPAPVAGGELLLAFLTFSVNPGAVTAPSGWTLAAGQLQPASGPRAAVYWAIAGASEPASYAFSWASAAGGGGRVASYTGADATAPIAAAMVGTTITSSKTATLPGLDATGAYQREVGFAAITTASSFAATLTGWSVRTPSFSSLPNGAFADRVLTAAGPSGSAGWTNTVNGSSAGIDSLSISLVLKQP